MRRLGAKSAVVLAVTALLTGASTVAVAGQGNGNAQRKKPPSSTTSTTTTTTASSTTTTSSTTTVPSVTTTTPTTTPASGSPGCRPAFFLGVVYDAVDDPPREDFVADVANFEAFLDKLGTTYCIPANGSTILAFDGGNGHAAATERAVKEEIARLGAAAKLETDATFFFFLSSHGNVWSGPLPESDCPLERLVSSYSALGERRRDGENGFLSDCELGTALKTHLGSVRSLIAVDCSFCGGFSDSITPASGTVSDGSVPVSAEVVAPTRIVLTGCAVTTECFGASDDDGVGEDNEGSNLYRLMRDVIEDEVGTSACDGWTAPGFPALEGIDVPAPILATDGKCGASEVFFASVARAYTLQSANPENDVVSIQQQFRIKYGFDSLDQDIRFL